MAASPLALEMKVCTLADSEAVCELVNKAYRGESGLKGWTTESEILDGQRIDPAMFKDIMEKEKCEVLGFREAATGSLVACVNVELASEEGTCYIGMVTVNPLNQNGGIGKQVLESAEAFAKKEWNCKTAKMSVISRRDTLIAFYKRRGYTDTGKSEPFPYGQDQFGLPKFDDLRFIVFNKSI